MAVGSNTFSDLGGAVSDIFGGFGSIMGSDLKARGVSLQAEGLRLKAKGDLTEAENYDRAGTLAGQNAVYAAASTRVRMMQQERETYKALGTERADIGAAGFAESGSALDLLRDSAQQGALAKAVLGAQGAIQEAGYKEQQASYQTMAQFGRYAAGVEQDMAGQMDEMASDTKSSGMLGAIGDFAGAAIKGAAALAFL